MIAMLSQVNEGQRPRLRVIDGEGVADAKALEVVAEVLSDGTVRMRNPRGPASRGDRFASGQVSGEGWTIWWDRRRWS